MHSDDRIVPDAGDEAPVVDRTAEERLEAAKTDAEKIKADGVDEVNEEKTDRR
jgi:hypothetical protein